MSYTANQYNYCTPLSSVVGLTDAGTIVDDVKYFTLFDNVLDGSFHPIAGSVGLWGASVADDTGSLPEPFVVTVEEELSINALSILGSSYSYPVEFKVDFYNGDEIIYTLTEDANILPAYLGVLPESYDITKYIITVSRISSKGVARLYNTYKAYYVHSIDTLPVLHLAARSLAVSAAGSDSLLINSNEVAAAMTNVVAASDTVPLHYNATTTVHNTIDKISEVLVVPFKDKSHILNTFDKKFDILPFNVIENISHVIRNMLSGDELSVDATDNCNAELYNIHRAMKEPTRQIFGKVYITYTDPMTEAAISSIEVSDEAYNSNKEQVIDGVGIAEGKYFTLYDNDLSGSYVLSSVNSQTGWTSATISSADGTFTNPPTLTLRFAAKPIKQITLHFDTSHECDINDFTVEFISQNSNTTKSFVDNTDSEVTISFASILADIVSIKLTVTRVSKPYYPVNLLDIPTVSTFLYAGYQDTSSLINMSLLEELTYEDDIEALGGVSANEITVALDNSNREFNFDNRTSAIATQLKRNRKIEPWLGAEVSPGNIEWYRLGVFWSYNWNVPYNSLTASVVGFDTIGLLDTSYFSNHHVLVDKSLGELIDYVLTDAKQNLPFLEWEVAEELYGVVIPYAWFSLGSHTAALRKISVAYPMHIYCNRDGKIIAAPQKLRLDHYNDIWSDSTNVIEKTYESLYTVLPNIINVKVVSPALKQAQELVKDELVFNVRDISKRVLNFNNPYISDLVVTVDCDNTVEYTYTVYSWGIEIDFTGTGSVHSIICNGTSLDTSNTVVLTQRDTESILLNGAVTRDISADFIQTSSLASLIINRIASLSENDKYDAEVTYRGDIALTINDPILLLDGIAPDNRYNIKRHQLTWDGALTGKATLNT